MKVAFTTSDNLHVNAHFGWAKNIDLYGFLSEHLINKSVDHLVKIDKKNFTNINLIKPLYSS